VSYCLLALWLAFYLRLEKFVPLSGPAIWAALASVLLAVPFFMSSGLNRAIFRYSGLPAMVAVGRAMLLYFVLFAAVFTFYKVQGVP
jgi:FlaA1/EpsC-like NDP-sugar epimerase